MQNNKEKAIGEIDRIAEMICKLSDDIWDAPETAFSEHTAAKLQCEVLSKLGFEVEKNLADIPTAFLGRFGSGHPIVGILGEFDALSGLSQKAGGLTKEPLEEGGNGHGCGHNLLGAGGIAGAFAMKSYLEKTGQSGTVIYYGCPGEEGGSGKAFMARDGVFDELDCAIAWHPKESAALWSGASLANYQIRYKFHGTSSHAAATPHLGRSALDAVQLMNMGVEFLREHMISEARIHYAITNSGGCSPNVVPSDAEVLYMIRAPKTPDVQEIYERVNKIAQGAALMTETELEIKFVKACSNIVQNYHIGDVIWENMHSIPLPEWTEEEIEYARQLQKTFGASADKSAWKKLDDMSPEDQEYTKKNMQGPLNHFIIPRLYTETSMPGSSDVGDVSWVCPTSSFEAITMAAMTPGHSWQLVAQGKSSYAHKGMLYAAKVIGGTGIDLFNHPEKVEAAKKELDERLNHRAFVSPIPKGVRPEALKA